MQPAKVELEITSSGEYHIGPDHWLIMPLRAVTMLRHYQLNPLKVLAAHLGGRRGDNYERLTLPEVDEPGITGVYYTTYPFDRIYITTSEPNGVTAFTAARLFGHKIASPSMGTTITMTGEAKVDITYGVMAAIWRDERNKTARLLDFLDRHLRGDWGNVGPAASVSNSQNAAAGKGAAVSMYLLPDGEAEIYLFTSLRQKPGRRSTLISTFDELGSTFRHQLKERCGADEHYRGG